MDFATRLRLPSMFAYREQVQNGGLMSYGVNVAENFRRAATFVTIPPSLLLRADQVIE